jgi:hypothetical protein
MLESPAAELAPVLVMVITAVGDHSLRALSRSATLARDRPDAIDQRQQLRDVVAVPAGQRDRKRHTGSVDMEVML